MKSKDNVHRCPWCGNFVSVQSIGNFITKEKCCSYCNHHCIRRIGRYTFFLILIICLIIISFNIRAYIALSLMFLIECILSYFNFIDSFVKSIKSLEKSFPTKGYKVTITLFPNQSKRQFLNDTVIPIVFVNKEGNAASSVCCVRVENRKSTKAGVECDLKLLEFGETPQEETNIIYLYNKGEIIATGTVISKLPISF